MNTKAICIRFKKEQITYLKKIARNMSAMENKDIKYSDLIRKCVEEKYPPTKHEGGL